MPDESFGDRHQRFFWVVVLHIPGCVGNQAGVDIADGEGTDLGQVFPGEGEIFATEPG